MPLSKTGWPGFYVVIFKPVIHLVMDENKRVTTLEIIDQIQELIFGRLPDFA